MFERITKYLFMCPLSINKEYIPVLKLKDRRGDNAPASRAEDLYDIYVYTSGLTENIPRNVLSTNTRLPDLKEIQTNANMEMCSNTKCQSLFADLKARICEIQMKMSDIDMVRSEVESIRIYCDIIKKLEVRIELLGKDNKHLKNRITLMRSQGTDACHGERCEVPRKECVKIIPTHECEVIQATCEPTKDTQCSQGEGNGPCYSVALPSLGLNPGDSVTDNAKQATRVSLGDDNRPMKAMTYKDACISPPSVPDEGSWQEVKGRNAKKSAYHSKKEVDPLSLPPLAGQRPVKSKMLYVRNIYRVQGQTDEDIMLQVKQHAKKKGVRVMATRLIKNRFAEDIVGCRVTVPLSNVDELLDVRFWPEPIECREWAMRIQKLKQNLVADTEYNRELGNKKYYND